MTPIAVEAFIPQCQECGLLLTAAKTPGALERHVGNYESCRFPSTITAILRRIWRLALAALLLASAGAWAQSGVFTTPQQVGVISNAQNVTVTAQAAGGVATVEVLTRGAAGLDFAVGGGTSTCPAATLAITPSPTTCMESVTFKPTAPGVRVGAVVLLDSNNNVLGATYLSGIGVGGLGVLAPGNILPVAGDGYYENAVLNDIPATQAELFLPSGVALDGAGNLYIADTLHHMIRMVCASASSATIIGTSCSGAGIITTIAGTGVASYTGDGQAASLATLNNPSGVALDGAGNLYIADTANNVIRMISAATGKIATVAGDGTAGYRLTDDGGPAISAELNQPAGIAIDTSGDLYIADTSNQRIRMVSEATGYITTVAGNGTAGYGGDSDLATSASTELNFPNTVAFDSLGNWYIADSMNNRVREVTLSTGIITTFAGNGNAGYTGDGDLAANSAVELDSPSDLAIDPAGNVYIADNQNDAIRMVNSTSGLISTYAVNGSGKYFSGGVFAPVSIHGPIGLALDSSANLYFADSLNMVVRKIQSNFVALDFTNTPITEGSTSGTVPQIVEDDGNAALNLTLPGIAVDPNDPYGVVNAALATPPTTCPTGNNPFFAAMDDTCVIGAVFAPNHLLGLTAATTLYPRIIVGTSGDTVNSPLNIELVGIATPLNATTLTLTSSLNPSVLGESVTFTATVSSTTGTPTGTVTFYDNNGLVLLAAVPLSGGVAMYTTSTLAIGSHTILASYGGDLTHLSGAATLVQTVNIIPTITVVAASTIGTATGQQLALVATVANDTTIALSASYTPTGTVTFYLGSITGTQLGVVPLSSGVAALVPQNLPAGSITIVAVYSGDTNHSASAGTLTTVNNSITFSLTVTPPNPTVATTQNTTVTVALASLNGFTDNITLGCGSLPVGVNCNFSIPSGASCPSASALSSCVTLLANQTVNVALTIDTNNPLGGGASAMYRHPPNARPGSGSVFLAGLFLPLSVLFGCVFWRFRKRYAAFMTVALVLLMGGAAMLVNGCSGFSQSSVAPGVYTIQVTGVGATTNITQYENVTLTITK